MKTIKNLVAIAIIGLLASCEKQMLNPSSNITIQDRNIENYSGIELGTVFVADITFSNTEEKIEIEANENLHAYIDVEKVGNNLVIKVKDNTNIQGKSTLRAHITTSNVLKYIAVRDASSLVMNNAQSGSSVELNVSGASTMSGKLNAVETTVYIDDASSLFLQGTSNTIRIHGSGASELSGLELSVMDVICQLSDASDASLTVSGTIDLQASDACSFRYKGDAVIIHQDLSDAAQIIKLF